MERREKRVNSAEYVAKLIADQKAAGTEPEKISWNAALACVEWAYVFGARGQYCTPANRRARYSDDHPTIKTKCKNFNGSSSAGCKGCKWYPNEKYTRIFDCRGFTYWILLQVYGWELMGAGATSQWSTASNWKAKGEIATMPKDTLCCLFVRKGSKMEHTGFGLNDETVECSNGVQYFKTRNKKWTHWGVPACVNGGVTPTPEPQPEKGTAIVTGKKVALREEASTRAKIIMRIDTGETVKLETAPDLWDYVSYKGKKGWMMREFLSESGNTAKVTGKRVALREEASTRAKIITRINTGETVQLETKPDLWDYVSYKGKKGWMMKEFLKEG